MNSMTPNYGQFKVNPDAHPKVKSMVAMAVRLKITVQRLCDILGFGDDKVVDWYKRAKGPNEFELQCIDDMNKRMQTKILAGKTQW